MIVEIAVLLFLIFGIQLDVEQGTLISVRILSHEINEIALFLNEIVPDFVGLFSFILMFLLIVGSASLYPELLKDPILGVMLTRPLSRLKLFLSEYAGMILGIFINVAVFSLLVSLILSVKTGELIASPVIGSCAFLAEFLIISAMCALIAILTESVIAVSVIGVGIYFFLGPLLSNIETVNNVLLMGISYLIPRTGKLLAITRELLMGGNPDGEEFIRAAIPAVTFFTIASVLFSRRDL